MAHKTYYILRFLSSELLYCILMFLSLLRWHNMMCCGIAIHITCLDPCDHLARENIIFIKGTPKQINFSYYANMNTTFKCISALNLVNGSDVMKYYNVPVHIYFCRVPNFVKYEKLIQIFVLLVSRFHRLSWIDRVLQICVLHGY